jgi:hypothetical protein
MKTIDTKSMLIGLLLASTIFFGMAAGDADDKKIEQLEKAIAAAETKEERDKLFTQLNALLEPQKPNKKPNAVPNPNQIGNQKRVIEVAGNGKQQWETGRLQVNGSIGPLSAAVQNKKNRQFILRRDSNTDALLPHNKHEGAENSNSWPEGWEPLQVLEVKQGIYTTWSVRRRLEFRTENKFDDPTK